MTRAEVDYDALYRRADEAGSEVERDRCLAEIEERLSASQDPGDRARLLMCRSRVHSNRWQSREVLDDALAAMELFAAAGEPYRELDAASLAAAFASRLGELSLAADLATKTILGIDSLADDRLMIEIGNRLGIFCYSFLDYDRAVEQFERSLAAAERCGDEPKTYRQLHNIADALLLAIRQERAAGAGDGRIGRSGRDRLERAEVVVRRLFREGTAELREQLGVQRLRIDLLLELGCPADALACLESASSTDAIVWSAGRSSMALAEARCLRALGRPADAVAAATRAVGYARESDDDLEMMLILDERLAAERDLGDFEAALADALEVKWRMWAIHRRQTAELVEQVWTRAAIEHERHELEAEHAAAIRSAEEDALTHVGNRRLLQRFLGDVAATSTRIGILMVDIDHFKAINDTYGHELGDQVLRCLGEIFNSDARTNQVVARYGGEEFVFALPGVEIDAARAFAERIRVKVACYPWSRLDDRLHVTISVGVACDDASSWRVALAAADGALYLAKRRGRNRVEVG